MNTIFFDSTVSDDIRRQQLYHGQLFVFSPSASSAALSSFAGEMIQEQRVDRAISALRRLVRRTDDRNRIGRKERQKPGCQSYSPRNAGLRFAAKASIPSCQSRVIMQASTPSSSVTSALS